jgi:hypothetical protein
MATKKQTFFDTDISVEVPIDVIEKSQKEQKKEQKEIAFAPPSFADEDDIEIIPFTMEKRGKKDEDEIVDEKEIEPVKDDDQDEAEEVKADDETAEDTGEKAPPDSSSSSPYLAFAKVLYEGGAITQLDEDTFLEIAEKQGETAALIEMVKQTVDDVFQSQFNKLPRDYRELLEAAGKGIPLREALKAKTDQQTYSTIKDKQVEEDEVLAERLVRESYILRGFSEEEASQEIQDAKDVDKLTAKALSALKYLNKHSKEKESQLEQQAENQRIDAEKQRAESLKNLKSTIADIGKLIPGTSVGKSEQDKLLDMLTTPVKQDPDTGMWLNKVWAKRATNPAQFDTVLAYLINKGIFDGKMDSLIRQAKSTAVKQLDEVLKSGVEFKGGTPVRRQAAVKKEEAVKALGAFKRKPDY